MSTNKLKNVNDIDVKISGLKILKKIGEGGMSVVYLAEQVSLKREIAVKVMRLEIASNDLDVQRFKHEAKTIAHLDHPNIINIYNIGQTAKGEVYFTMPYLNHGDLSNYILESEQEFIKLLKSICEGLGFAHTRGVVHRDIKPENLLFDKFGNIQIADFGIAISKEGSRMTKEHQVVGSAQYMSPEQARSNEVGIQTDIYSLGIVIYERLTGSVPFDADDSITILVDHVSKEPPKLDAKMRHWQNLIDKCLAKLPEDRFKSMQELKEVLDRIPINSIQRTNDSIQNVLKTSNGKHLKWFIPSLIVLIIAAMLGLNSKTEVVEPIVDAPVIIVETLKAPVILPEEDKVAQPIIEEQETLKADNVVQTNLALAENDISSEVIVTQAGTNQELVLESVNDLASEPLNSEQLQASQLDDDTQKLLTRAYKNIKSYRLSKPVNDNATDQLLKILTGHPTHSEAIRGLESIGGKYFQLVKTALLKFDLNTALKHSRSLQKFNKKTKFVNKNYQQQQQDILKIIAQLDMSSTSISIERVNTLSRVVKLFDPDNRLINDLAGIANIKTDPKVGEKLLDELGIETILVRNNLSVSLAEITLEQYTEFAQSTKRSASKCKHNGAGFGGLFKKVTWQKPGFAQTGEHPITCITQSDAHDYTQWLSSQTGNKYRLPNKQEWLSFAILANNDFVPCKTANLTGKEAAKIRNKEKKYNCNDTYKYTAPVAAFTVNKIGLFDMQGNVSEWVACNNQPCKAPTAMGSSWYHGKKSNKTDLVTNLKENAAFTNIGFRLVRDL